MRAYVCELKLGGVGRAEAFKTRSKWATGRDFFRSPSTRCLGLFLTGSQRLTPRSCITLWQSFACGPSPAARHRSAGTLRPQGIPCSECTSTGAFVLKGRALRILLSGLQDVGQRLWRFHREDSRHGPQPGPFLFLPATKPGSGISTQSCPSTPAKASQQHGALRLRLASASLYFRRHCGCSAEVIKTGCSSLHGRLMAPSSHRILVQRMSPLSWV